MLYLTPNDLEMTHLTLSDLHFDLIYFKKFDLQFCRTSLAVFSRSFLWCECSSSKFSFLFCFEPRTIPRICVLREMAASSSAADVTDLVCFYSNQPFRRFVPLLTLLYHPPLKPTNIEDARKKYIFNSCGLFRNRLQLCALAKK